MPEKREALTSNPRDPDGIRDGFDCVCQVCGSVFHDRTPSAVCGYCDYLNGLEEYEDDR